MKRAETNRGLGSNGSQERRIGIHEAPLMSFSMASLLVHDHLVPAEVRAAVRQAHEGPPARRAFHLESAARILFHETGLGCADARELLDLRPGDCLT